MPSAATIAVFCASRWGSNPHFVQTATDLGALIASQGRTLLYGGSNLGCMGAVSSAVLQAGGRAVSVIPSFFSQDVIHSQPLSELVLVPSLSARKETFIQRADAFIALPGGIGTLDEILEVMAANQLQRCRKPIALLNVDGFYDPFLRLLQHYVSDELLSPESLHTLLVAQSPADALHLVDDFLSA